MPALQIGLRMSDIQDNGGAVAVQCVDSAVNAGLAFAAQFVAGALAGDRVRCVSRICGVRR
jgi:hypothetical protein